LGFHYMKSSIRILTDYLKRPFRILTDILAFLGGILLFSDLDALELPPYGIFFNLILPIIINIVNLIVIFKVKSVILKATIFIIPPILFLTLLNFLGAMLIVASGMLCLFQMVTPWKPKPLDQQIIPDAEI
jgi:hypothetical protein